MTFTRLPIVASLLAAGACALVVDVYAWEAARVWVIPALSIIAAAVLVRLARGVPVTNADHLTSDDVDDVVGAFTRLSRSLRSLLAVVLGAVVASGLASPVAAFIATYVATSSDLGNRSGSAVVGLVVGYSFARIFQIAQSDVSIADLQARLLKKAVARKASKKFEETGMAVSSFKQPEDYGKPLQ